MNSVTDSQQHFFGLPRVPQLPGNIEPNLLLLAAGGTRGQSRLSDLLADGRTFL